MVSATDYPHQSGHLRGHEHETERPRKRRFRLLSALAAPFKDMDERALHKKHGPTEVRNNSKGNVFVRQTAAPAKVPVRRFPRGDD
ncbi:MAG TPA: hypothetical protein VG308_01895 [Stellaceae bacterium]|jgi:hypothetical protein|nr:hypothetical protein [Stellaceae bacterium]